MKAPSRRLGFTLVEMLVVIAIICLLAALILTVAWRTRYNALQVSCLNNIRQMGMNRLGAGSGHGDPSLSCPMGATYALNSLAPDEMSAYRNPAGTVMLFESNGVTEGIESDVYPLHNHGANYVYWDGHAKWSKAVPPFRPQ